MHLIKCSGRWRIFIGGTREGVEEGVGDGGREGGNL